MADGDEKLEPSLPDPLRDAARELRRAPLPEGFESRLAARLVAADRTQWRHGSARTRRFSRMGSAWLALIPSAAGMAMMLHLAFGNGTDEGADELWHQVQAQEVELVLADDGRAWIGLDLLTHHHDGADAVVRVEAPENVQVVTSDSAQPRGASPVCQAERCVHSFSHPTHTRAPQAVRVGVLQPGRYRISVEHASSKHRVREEFVLNARR